VTTPPLLSRDVAAPAFRNWSVIGCAYPSAARTVRPVPSFAARSFVSPTCHPSSVLLPPVPFVVPSRVRASQGPSAFDSIKGYLISGPERVALLVNNAGSFTK
jgi:hypothetical protein